FLPVVGIVIGILLWLWYLLCQFLAIGDLLFAAGAIIIPILVSGGIHLDGFADTVDAISSHQSRERKLEILKDSNSGAFAVIYCGVYLVACLGLFSELHQAESVAVLCCGYVLSRAIAALSAIILPNARKNGMLATFTSHIDKKKAMAAIVVEIIVILAAMIILSPCVGIICGIIAAVVLLLYRRLALAIFGGATGDTTGCFLQICELMLLFAVVFSQFILGVLR
ncbi:MAG: adenosylcobinamide-GDP ribazoletransferase, partial [Clostridiales bacterium]